MKLEKKLTWLLLFSLLFVVCTIKDDNGNPMTNVSPDEIIENSASIPGLYVSAEKKFSLPKDTLRLSIQVMTDTTDTMVFAGALVTVQSSSGWISSDSLIMNSDGRAVLLFSDSIIGDKELIFSCYQAQQIVKFKVTETPDQIQKNIIAQPKLNQIPANGTSQTKVTVKVINDNHNPIVNQYVQFITTAGVIVGDNPPQEGTNISGQSKTDQNGIATATLTSSSINDTAYITVYLVGSTNLNDETAVVFSGVTINTTIDSSNITKGKSTIVTAEVLNASGNPIAQTPIFFKLGKGSQSNLTVQSTDSLTGFNGKAQALITGNDAGTDTLLIISAGSISKTKINVTDLSLSLTVDDPVLQATKNLATTLRAQFRTLSGGVPNGGSITCIRHYPNANNTPTKDTLTGTFDKDGNAALIIKAITHEADMRLEVVALDNSGNIATGEIIVHFIKTRKMIMRALPPLILANGTSKAKISVQVKNENNNPIVGDTLQFSTDAGVITNEAITDDLGKAFVDLVSDRRNTIATIKTWLKKDISQRDSLPVEFAGVTLGGTVSPSSITSNGKDTALIIVKLADASENSISGEQVNFSTVGTTTKIIPVNLTTNTRGEAQCKIVGTGSGSDTIVAVSAGATTKIPIHYSTNKIIIDTVDGSYENLIANGLDSTELKITYTDGSGTAITNSTIKISVTIGNLGQVFAKEYQTDNTGKFSFFMKNPNFANTAIITAIGEHNGKMSTATFPLYFRADNLKYILLTGSPEVISTNGDRTTITATAFDSLNNPLKGAKIAFNILEGPGGGESISPSTAITGIDGKASTYLVSGDRPSQFRGVKIVASNFSAAPHIKSDTIKLTIAGPPHHITIRTNIGNVKKYQSTYGKNVAAIITDVNGNPVADGTEVTFSLNVTGYQTFRLFPRFEFSPIVIDTIRGALLRFEDHNNNFLIDSPQEDINSDGMLNRGENVNGDKTASNTDLFLPGPGFHDINWNGIRDYKFDPREYARNPTTYPILPAEPAAPGSIVIDPIDSTISTTRFADYNGDGRWTLNEPLISETMTDAEYESFPGYDPTIGRFIDIDWNQNGVAEPATAVTITRTVQTVNGIANNEIIYGQSDALRIMVMLNAECKGLTTISPEEFILPIAPADLASWSYRK